MELLKRAKLSMRLSGDEFDQELQELLNTAREDLIRMGAKPQACDAPLGQLACITYTRAYFDPGAPEFERYMDSYRSIANEIRRSRVVGMDE